MTLKPRVKEAQVWQGIGWHITTFISTAYLIVYDVPCSTEEYNPGRIQNTQNIHAEKSSVLNVIGSTAINQYYLHCHIPNTNTWGLEDEHLFCQISPSHHHGTTNTFVIEMCNIHNVHNTSEYPKFNMTAKSMSLTCKTVVLM